MPWKKGARSQQPGKKTAVAPVSQRGALSACSTQKDEVNNIKEEEKGEKKDEEKPSELHKNDDKNAGSAIKDEKKGEEEVKKEEVRRFEELKPKQIKHNEKEERIAQGKEVRAKGDYPTFNDVESDWDSDKDKKVKDKKDDEKKDDEKKEGKALLSEMKTQSVTQKIAPPAVTQSQLTTEPLAKVAASGGKWTQQLHNSGDKKVIFKIRCSNNNEYRVSPVFGFVDACGQTNIEVTRLNGAPKEDKLVVQYVAAPDGATDAQAAFARLEPTDNVMIKLIAT